jgi:hypothetical protein
VIYLVIAELFVVVVAYRLIVYFLKERDWTKEFINYKDELNKLHRDDVEQLLDITKKEALYRWGVEEFQRLLDKAIVPYSVEFTMKDGTKVQLERKQTKLH